MGTIRLLQADDLAACMRLKEAAGWNQTARDWLALLRAEPAGCFGLDCDGQLAATATAVVHGGVGWIGMVLTDPRHRGQGFATRLLGHALAYLEPKVDCVKLDATAEGEPIYRRFGFVAEQPIERWLHPGLSAAGNELSGSYSGPMRHPAIPIEATAESSGAWAAARSGSEAWYFGPCYGNSNAAVEAVAQNLIAGRGRTAWDLFPDHPASSIAANLGFAPARRLLRMVRGTCSPTPPDVYAIAGFEWG